MKFDVVIVGAGPSGCISAINIAKKGYKVAILDKDEEKSIGYRTGGGVIKVDTFSSVGLPRSQGKELIAFLDTFNIYSPTARTKKTVNHTAIIVDRLLMNQRLLQYAKEAGSQLFSETQVEDLLIDNDFVKGVTTKDDKVFHSKILIDASGFSGIVRKKLPHSFNIENEIDNKYIAKAYVELLKNPNTSENYLNSYLAVDNGYIWQTPTEIGYGSLDHSIDLKKRLHSFIDEHKLNVETDSNYTSYGAIAVRQNIPNMVGNGVVIVGDAACMISPIEGAGITTSIRGAKLASDIILECLEKNDFSQSALWAFNVKYNRTIGANLAYMDMLRRGLIGLKPDDIDFAFEKEVITAKDVLDSITGDIANVSVLDKAQRAIRGIRRPHILLRMENCMNKSKELKHHYSNFPDNPENLLKWIEKKDKINNSFY
ncbi:MAG: digeranylgeranylglycerophospholipid reductase [Candidatus Sericytochromatia bacterium]|nr:MAG: digeranylgeranylglycerophospholipid reductase [Candidatus Sericytochromatia bacterium]